MSNWSESMAEDPWYRQPWPWILIALPASAVVAGMITLYLAVRSDDGVVADDYYTRGLAINQVLDRQDRARQLGLSAELEQNGQRFVLTLQSGRELALPARIRLALVNPVRAGLDQSVLLERQGRQYVGTFEPVRNGRWKITLEDEGKIWQLFTETSFPLTHGAVLLP